MDTSRINTSKPQQTDTSLAKITIPQHTGGITPFDGSSPVSTRNPLAVAADDDPTTPNNKPSANFAPATYCESVDDAYYLLNVKKPSITVEKKLEPINILVQKLFPNEDEIHSIKSAIKINAMIPILKDGKEDKTVKLASAIHEKHQTLSTRQKKLPEILATLTQIVEQARKPRNPENETAIKACNFIENDLLPKLKSSAEENYPFLYFKELLCHLDKLDSKQIEGLKKNINSHFRTLDGRIDKELGSILSTLNEIYENVKKGNSSKYSYLAKEINDIASDIAPNLEAYIESGYPTYYFEEWLKDSTDLDKIKDGAGTALHEQISSFLKTLNYNNPTYQFITLAEAAGLLYKNKHTEAPKLIIANLLYRITEKPKSYDLIKAIQHLRTFNDIDKLSATRLVGTFIKNLGDYLPHHSKQTYATDTDDSTNQQEMASYNYLPLIEAAMRLDNLKYKQASNFIVNHGLFGNTEAIDLIESINIANVNRNKKLKIADFIAKKIIDISDVIIEKERKKYYQNSNILFVPSIILINIAIKINDKGYKNASMAVANFALNKKAAKDIFMHPNIYMISHFTSCLAIFESLDKTLANSLAAMISNGIRAVSRREQLSLDEIVAIIEIVKQLNSNGYSAEFTMSLKAIANHIKLKAINSIRNNNWNNKEKLLSATINHLKNSDFNDIANEITDSITNELVRKIATLTKSADSHIVINEYFVVLHSHNPDAAQAIATVYTDRIKTLLDNGEINPEGSDRELLRLFTDIADTFEVRHCDSQAEVIKNAISVNFGFDFSSDNTAKIE